MASAIRSDGTIDVYGYAVSLFEHDNYVQLICEFDTAEEAQEAVPFLARRYQAKFVEEESNE